MEGGGGGKVRSICDAYELRGMENDLQHEESENEKVCKVNVENLEIGCLKIWKLEYLTIFNWNIIPLNIKPLEKFRSYSLKL